MKVSDAISNWPRKRWARDDGLHAAVAPLESDSLRLRWFSTPNDEGWFRIIATDSEHCHWSTFCRIDDPAIWPALEVKLSAKLRASLAEIGALELDVDVSDRTASE